MLFRAILSVKLPRWMISVLLRSMVAIEIRGILANQSVRTLEPPGRNFTFDAPSFTTPRLPAAARLRNPAPASTRHLICALPLTQAGAYYHGSGKCNDFSSSVTRHPHMYSAPHASFTCKIGILIAASCIRAYRSYSITRHATQSNAKCDEAT
jgi:hypothetical protein